MFSSHYIYKATSRSTLLYQYNVSKCHRHMYDQCYILKIGLWVLGSLAEQTQNSDPLLVKQGDGCRRGVGYR